MKIKITKAAFVEAICKKIAEYEAKAEELKSVSAAHEAAIEKWKVEVAKTIKSNPKALILSLSLDSCQGKAQFFDKYGTLLPSAPQTPEALCSFGGFGEKLRSLQANMHEGQNLLRLMKASSDDSVVLDTERDYSYIQWV